MTSSRRRTALTAIAVSSVLAVSLAGCSVATTSGSTSTTSSIETVVAASGSLWDTSTVHTVAIDVDEEALADMIDTYLSSGDKEWISATVTIDGVAYENVGIRLKGNSSLRGITTDTPAQELPWRIRLDKFVDGQSADGVTDFTIRSNSSASSLNEAVALDLLSEAGLASEQTAATRVSVNGSDAVLRLSVENLKEDWVASNFPDAGADSVLYKADSEGTWSWQGADADYSGSFDVEAGPENYEPLVELLDLLNNGTDAEIAERLPELVDLESFATYLAFQALIDNFDDIDGPGNNSYLFWDSATGMFTIVAWGHNLAFGAQPAGGGGGGQDRGDMGQAPDGQVGTQPGRTGTPGAGAGQPPEGGQDGRSQTGDAPQGGGGGGFGGGSNPLVEAMTANAEWSALIDDARTRLQALFFDDGVLEASVTSWTALLADGASDLVDAATLRQEADAILAYAQ